MLYYGSQMIMLNIIKRNSLLLQYHYPIFYAMINMHVKNTKRRLISEC